MSKEVNLRNLGPVSREQLALLGIYSTADLAKAGVVDTYVVLKNAYPKRINKAMLWALAGAVLNLHWLEIPPEIKESLVNELNEKMP